MPESLFPFPRLNEPAPDFKAKPTLGDRSLADSKGNGLGDSGQQLLQAKLTD